MVISKLCSDAYTGSVAVVLSAMLLLCLSGCPLRVNEPAPTPVSDSGPTQVSESTSEPTEVSGSESPAEQEGQLVPVTEDSFEAEVLKAAQPVLVEFWAPGCPPCYAVKPILEDLAQEYAGKIKFVLVDSSRNPGLARRYRVAYVPLFVALKNGEEADRWVGFSSEEMLRARVATLAEGTE